MTTPNDNVLVAAMMEYVPDLDAEGVDTLLSELRKALPDVIAFRIDEAREKTFINPLPTWPTGYTYPDGYVQIAKYGDDYELHLDFKTPEGANVTVKVFRFGGASDMAETVIDWYPEAGALGMDLGDETHEQIEEFAQAAWDRFTVAESAVTYPAFSQGSAWMSGFAVGQNELANA